MPPQPQINTPGSSSNKRGSLDRDSSEERQPNKQRCTSRNPKASPSDEGLKEHFEVSASGRSSTTASTTHPNGASAAPTSDHTSESARSEEERPSDNHASGRTTAGSSQGQARDLSARNAQSSSSGRGRGDANSNGSAADSGTDSSRNKAGPGSSSPLDRYTIPGTDALDLKLIHANLGKFLALKMKRPLAGKVLVLDTHISNPAPAKNVLLALGAHEELLGMKSMKHLVLVPVGKSQQIDFSGKQSLFHYNDTMRLWEALMKSLKSLQLQKKGQIKWGGLCEDHVPPVAKFVIQKQDAWELQAFKATILVPLLQLHPTCGSPKALVDLSERSKKQPGKYGLTAPQAKEMSAKFEDWHATFKQRMARQWSEISNISSSLAPLDRLDQSRDALAFAKKYGFLDVTGDLEEVERIQSEARKAVKKNEMMALENQGDLDHVGDDDEGADEEADGAELRDLRPDPLRDYDSSGGGWYHPSGTNILREHEPDFRYHDEAARYDASEESEDE